MTNNTKYAIEICITIVSWQIGNIYFALNFSFEILTITKIYNDLKIFVTFKNVGSSQKLMFIFNECYSQKYRTSKKIFTTPFAPFVSVNKLQ